MYFIYCVRLIFYINPYSFILLVQNILIMIMINIWNEKLSILIFARQFHLVMEIDNGK